MTAGVNKVILIGHLGSDPEFRVLPGGTATANLSLCTGEPVKGQDPDWHRVVLYGRRAEIAAQYLKKGRQVYIEGKLATRRWKDAADQDKSITEVIVDFGGKMQMLGKA